MKLHSTAWLTGYILCISYSQQGYKLRSTTAAISLVNLGTTIG
jgi:hypothetical protein